jgi:DNA polymerase-1
VFNTGSTLQLQKLLYETMGLPVRVRTKPTDAMRKAGKREGNPQTNEIAIAFAKLKDATPTQIEVLEALRLMKMVETRRGLYYSTYPYFVHWKTGRIHSSHNQSSTNTRRASSSKPNLQQMPKHPKIEGQPAKFREVIVPHKPGAVIVSMDFMAQELRVIADYSQDPNMLACYVGDNLRDMHAFTGMGIAMRKKPELAWAYEAFVDALNDKTSNLHLFVKECRALGKKTNFTTEYGAMAPKLAVTLLVDVDEAQSYIDAREAAFPVVKAWKAGVIEEAYEKGYVTTKLGARRHLAKILTDSDRWVAMKGGRQSVNFKIQGSSGEMTKWAEGRIWKARLTQRFDCQIISPIHDEVVASVTLADLPEFLKAMHACMVAPYADMQVPVMSSISFGPSFGVQIEAGELPEGPGIEAAMVEYHKLMTKLTTKETV